MNDQVKIDARGNKGYEPKTCLHVLNMMVKMIFPDKKPEVIFADAIQQMQMAALAASALGRNVKFTATFNGSYEIQCETDEEAMKELADLEQSEILTRIIPAINSNLTAAHKSMHGGLVELLFESLKEASRAAAEAKKPETAEPETNPGNH